MRRFSRGLRVVKWAATLASLVLIGLAVISFRYSVYVNYDRAHAVRLLAGGISVVPQVRSHCAHAPPLSPPPLVYHSDLDFVWTYPGMVTALTRANNWPQFSGDVVIPIWLLFAPAALLSIALWIADRRLVRSGFCSTCGYDLTGNVSGRCPECGTLKEKCEGSQ